MIIKSFTAPTVAAALKMVKISMGGSAVVLRTRVLSEKEAVRPDSRVELTACIDEGVVSPGNLDAILSRDKKIPDPPKTVPANEINKPSNRDEASDTAEPKSYALETARLINGELQKSLNPEPGERIGNSVKPLYVDMLDADMPAEYARQLIKMIEERRYAGEDIDQTAYEVLHEDISKMIAPDISFKPGMKIVFAGHTGAGKTSALAKLAASLTLQKKMKIQLSSLDDIKVSAYEEITGYGDILDLPVEMNPERIGRNDKSALTLIDSPSIPYDNRCRLDLIKKIRSIKPDLVFMVFSVCCRTRDMMDSINILESLSPSYLIASHLDETSRWGGMTAMSRYLEVPLVYVMDAPGGIGRLKKASAEDITRQLLKIEEAVYE